MVHESLTNFQIRKHFDNYTGCRVAGVPIENSSELVGEMASLVYDIFCVFGGLHHLSL
jgi:hypothetical protein